MDNLVIYVRHAESEANVVIHNKPNKSDKSKLSQSQENLLNSYADPHITSLGKTQAAHTATHLIQTILKLNKTKVTIWVSPFKRTIETAKPFIIGCFDRNIDYTVTFLPELQEYTTNKKPLSEEQKESGLIIHQNFDSFLHKLLTFNEMLKNQLKKQNQEQILIVFGHSIFFSTLLSYHIMHERITPTEISSLQLPNCSLSCEMLEVNPFKWATFIVGSVAHLNKNIITGNHVPLGYL